MTPLAKSEAAILGAAVQSGVGAGASGSKLPYVAVRFPVSRRTPQACTFRDHYRELAELGAGVFGPSTQDTAYQREMATRLHLPFPVLNDSTFVLATALVAL